MSTTILESGQKLQTHSPEKCAGETCCIHNPSDHRMSIFPRYWRSDWGGMMERICPHGVGHPDPDWLARQNPAHRFDVHGCDGCCK